MYYMCGYQGAVRRGLRDTLPLLCLDFIPVFGNPEWERVISFVVLVYTEISKSCLDS